MMRVIRAAIRRLQRNKPAYQVFQAAIALTLLLEGMRLTNWIGWTAFSPSAFESLFWIVFMFLFATWALSRIDFGGGR